MLQVDMEEENHCCGYSSSGKKKIYMEEADVNAENMYVNEFTARGIVLETGSTEYHRKNLTLLVQERRNNTLKLDIALEPGIGDGIQKKDRVIVSGYARGFEFHNDALNKDSEVMYLAGTAVEKETTELEKRFGENLGNFYPEPVFRSFLSGKVMEVIPAEGKSPWAKLKIETRGGGTDLRASRVVIRYYTGGRLPVFDYQKGDVICARLSAYTPEKENKSGKLVRYQNLNVEDIAYLFRVHRKNDRGAELDVDCGLKSSVVRENSGKHIKTGPEKSREASENEESLFADDSELLSDSL